MRDYRVRHPVAFLVYKRPDCTREVFARIRAARPTRLFVIADGPKDKPGEAEACREVRRIVSDVDWDCEVSIDAADVNLGLRRRVSGGLDWVFRQSETAIILEDDCIPSPSFFRFCDELLDRYRDEPRVMTICGSNYLGRLDTDTSYVFTVRCALWGWATWRRAWETYDVDLASWPRNRTHDPFEGLPLTPKEARGLAECLDNLADEDESRRKFDTWDYQWFYNCYARKGLAVTPRVNLVSNVGFGEDATHTKVKNHKLARIPAGQLEFPLVHPRSMEVSMEFERAYARRIINKTMGERLANMARRLMRRVALAP